jgi:hypothetical protein
MRIAHVYAIYYRNDGAEIYQGGLIAASAESALSHWLKSQAPAGAGASLQLRAVTWDGGWNYRILCDDHSAYYFLVPPGKPLT